jgi:NTP pyrophosphatase (non-canonical NTP hydrolase)
MSMHKLDANLPVSPTASSAGPATPAEDPTISLRGFQELIREMYLPKDVARGVDGTFMWLMEEVGELAGALRSGTPEEKAAEFADVLAWLATIANVAEVDLQEAVRRKYGDGCPGCGAMRCRCDDQGKP